MKVQDFLALFEEVKQEIAAFEGCEGLTLMHEAAVPNVMFTYSLWKSEHHLEAYRFSELFKDTWARTKVLFNDRPSAWSLVVHDQVK